MTLRSFMALGALVILMGINGFLLYKEYTWHDEYKGIAPPEFKKRIDAGVVGNVELVTFLSRDPGPPPDPFDRCGKRRPDQPRRGLRPPDRQRGMILPAAACGLTATTCATLNSSRLPGKLAW